jgi:hypothetical protein
MLPLDRHVGKQADLLDDVADLAAKLHRGHVAGVLAIDQHPTRCRRHDAVDHLERGGLAATGRAQQHTDFARFHFHVDVVGSHHLARGRMKNLGQLLELDHGDWE